MMRLEDNLNELQEATGLSRKRLALIGIGVLVATTVCISIIVAVSVKSSSKQLSSPNEYYKRLDSFANEIKWVRYNSTDFSLTDAFSGGIGATGEEVYVCRAEHPYKYYDWNYELIPGTFFPSNGSCLVPYDDIAHSHSVFDLLVTKHQSRLIWVNDSFGKLKTGAISGGISAYKEDLYISQFNYNGYTVLGKIHLAHMKASGPVETKEIYRSVYKILCLSDHVV